jgi:hypothetical protein
MTELTAIGGASTIPVADDPWESMVPEFDPAAQGGYMSSGEVLGWIATVGQHTYAEMRQQMVATELRRDLQQDLTSFKAQMENAKQTKDTSALVQAANDLVAKYAKTQFAGHVDSVLAIASPEMKALMAAQANPDQAKDAATNPPLGIVTGGYGVGSSMARVDVDALAGAVLNQLDGWVTDIQGKVDALGTQDQLALIKIQELNSRVTQATQLGSQLLAARDQAASTAIMNLKG